MAKTNPKPRSTAKSKEKSPPPPPKPRFKLDWDRWEEIAAIAIIILGILTGLGAFNLSGGFLLSSWTLLLQSLLGWGVYFTPILLLGLGAWLFADSLNKTWNIGWERPIGLGLLYFLLLVVSQWIAYPSNPLSEPAAFTGGGYTGWLFTSLIISAFGEVGTILALIALAGIALILLFNISLPEFIRRVAYLMYVMRHLPTEIQNYRLRRTGQPIPSQLQQPIDYPQINPPPKQPTLKPEPRQSNLATPPAVDKPPLRLRPVPILEEKPKDAQRVEPAPAQGSLAARIIGGNSPAPVPVIQREWRLPDIDDVLEDSVAETEEEQPNEIEQQEELVSEEEQEKRIRERVRIIRRVLDENGVPGKVTTVDVGEIVTRYGIQPGFIEREKPNSKSQPVKVQASDINALRPHLESALQIAPIRVDPPGPGENTIGIKVPNQKRPQACDIIERTLQDFGIPVSVVSINPGPAITQYGVEPGFIEQKGPDAKVHSVKVKVSLIVQRQKDLELALAAAPIRIEAPIPGRNLVGIEVPNQHRSRVTLRSVMESTEFKKSKSKLRLALGQDVAGQPVSDDLAKMPHLLIAGATGSGKSVCINAIIACLLCKTTPDEVNFIMIDPKRVELVNFNGIGHLKQPVVVDMDKAVAALQGAVEEMDRRFRIFAKMGARNIEIYHHMIEDKPSAERLPFLIVIVDELADLMMIAADQVEKTITRLAQMARATGIHLILATQRPSVDVVTGLIKANFPSRISFAVTSQIDSRVVLDAPGAEKLLGHGDMLYMASDSSKLQRLQGCFVSDSELEKLVAHWRELPPTPAETSPTIPTEPQEEYLQTPLWDQPFPQKKADNGGDDMLPQAIEVVKQSNRASASLLQRKLRVGYQRAARLMELLEEKGIVGPDGGPTKGRPVLDPGNAPKKSSNPTTPSDRGSDEGLDLSDFSEDDFEEMDEDT